MASVITIIPLVPALSHCLVKLPCLLHKGYIARVVCSEVLVFTMYDSLNGFHKVVIQWISPNVNCSTTFSLGYD